MKVKFPYQYIGSNKFGRIFRPYADVFVLNKDIGSYIHKMMVVDTGADFTIFPRKDAYHFGIDLENETTRDKIFGVGGEEIIFLYENLKVKLGNVKLTIPCGFINRNDVPALLGRQHFMELFQVSFAKFQTTFQR